MSRSLLVGGRLLPAGLALALAAGLGLAGCSPSTKEAAQQTGEAVGQATKEGAGAVGDAAKEGAGAMGDAAKKAAMATGQAALAPAVGPVLDLLKKSEADVKAGNITAAVSSMSGFQALWATAGPVIQPLAGDKWPAIDSAAQMVLKTFAPGTTPDSAAAGSAITGLMGPLGGLLGK
ncbi:MAG: hypothetical protein VKP70_03660 [Cyanobacteriota bacterium]|nr:hypothetical protein [Cyanobacteriota bacterium]